jgi:GT2 family glycosyltransferase
MSGSDLSVVVASVNGFPYLGACLDALAETAPWAEVVVADSTDEGTRERVRREWPAVRLLAPDGRASVPELRARGIAAASAPYVALIEDHCVVRPGWAAGLVAHHRRGRPVVGGPIANAVARRARDRAAFYCEYSAFLEPVTEGATDDLPGMNVSYDRAAIAAMQDLLDQGRWETWLHPRLRESGFAFWIDPALTIDHAKDFGLREFTGQRWHYARAYAGERCEQLGPRRIAYALGAPLLPFVLGRRILRNVRRSDESTRAFAVAAPLVAYYLAVWAAGEAVGYLAGGGDSLLEVR